MATEGRKKDGEAPERKAEAEFLTQQGRKWKAEGLNLQYRIKCGEAVDDGMWQKTALHHYTKAANYFERALECCGRDEAIQIFLTLAEIYADEDFAAQSAAYRESKLYDPRRALQCVCFSYSLAMRRRQEKGGRVGGTYYQELICTLCEKMGMQPDDPEVVEWKARYYASRKAAGKDSP